jgi:NAD(P)H-nitrite reductase large subunit
VNELSTKYLIIGNSAGGIGAAEGIRAVDKTGEITIASDESYPTYSRPLISEYLAGTYSLERMAYRPADFYEKNGIRTFLGKKAVKLDPANHIITFASGEEIQWEKLVLATGGVPIVPPMKGIPDRGVFNFTTLDDAKAIDQYLSGREHAVVIGGGLIGVGVTEALVRRGINVTIVEMKDRILNLILDETASALEVTVLRKAGVEIVTGHTVSEIRTQDSVVSGVILDDESHIPCKIIIVAIGVRPRIDLVAGTGMKVNRGIVVDKFMATSLPDVYACGDAAEAFDYVYGECRLTPIWPNAYLGGRTAGLNMAGKPTEYPGGTAMNSLKYFGLDIVSAGIVNPPDASYEVVSQNNDGNYHKVVLKNDCVVGMVFAGAIERAGIVFNLMKNKINSVNFKPLLVSREFGLASLPGELWRPHFNLAELVATMPEKMVGDVAGE